ncbi:unnamed protein product [Acanthoscelides obtectus]|uniref:Uncharacterized protein n=1 Tax=Acanthoscelides obtectus TaxID=200917 RepID=A0A9P0KE80_ACAOB|nr:unnamed protein product [Acanthoscelides obtectus]CAK1680221.1 hypothetical protein AOBTE_LOCUS32536 [Acanthoscelides obtectus]
MTNNVARQFKIYILSTMKNDFKLYLLVLLLFTQEVRTKSIPSQEDQRFSKRSGNESDNTELHEYYKSKHKPKAEDDHIEEKRHSRYENSEWRPQCAVIYKNNEPVGILQPFEDAFKFRPLNFDATIVDLNPIPAKRKTLMDVLYPSKFEDDSDEENDADEKVGVINKRDAHTDRNYALALAKFKISSRIGLNRLYRKAQQKREKEEADEEHLRSLRKALMKRKTDASEAVEVELADILNDMGLIDDSDSSEEKREAEDENMESGSNAISMVEDEPNSTTNKAAKDKRDELATPSFNASTAASSSLELTEVSDLKEDKEEQKREITETTKTTKVTGSKEEQKREAEGSVLDKPDADEVSLYEKRVEREIRDKIQKLKEEVKKEIDALKLAKSKGSDSNRKKREVVNTLLDEETQDIDPIANYDGAEKKHVRRKRSVHSKKGGDKVDKGLVEARKRRYVSPQQKKEAYKHTEKSKEYEDTSLMQSKKIAKERNIHFLDGVRKPEPELHSSGLRKILYIREPSERADSLAIDETQDNSGVNVRRKREGEEYEENEYAGDYEELVDDSNSFDEMKDNTPAAEDKPNCKCDKNGNNCKCRKQVTDADYSNFIVNPERVIRSAIASNQHCHCDKNRNCKCGTQEAEPDWTGSRRLGRDGDKVLSKITTSFTRFVRGRPIPADQERGKNARPQI